MARSGTIDSGAPRTQGGVRPLAELRAFNFALRRQVEVVRALFYREAGLRHSKSMRLGFLLQMVEPLIIIGAICLLFYIVDRQPMYGDNMILFVGTGVFPVYLFVHTATGIREPVHGARFGRYPIQLPLDAILAHIFLRGLSSSLTALAFFTALYFSGVREAVPHNPAAALLSFGVIFMLGVGMGVLNPVIGCMLPLWDSIWPAISRASLHFAGIYYVADYMSPEIRNYLWFNPLVHGIDWFRLGFYPLYPTRIMNRGVLLAITAVVMFLGLCMERVFREKLLKGER
jgi:capsular polysaccharide transport system permease protein